MSDRRPTIALLLEGTYPYVSGGVSSWVHDIIRGLPELGFTLFHIAAREDVPLDKRYPLPDNVGDQRYVECGGVCCNVGAKCIARVRARRQTRRF